MGEKLNLIVYMRDKELFFYAGANKVSGVFQSEQDISGFLDENRVSSLTLVFSRPAIFIRTLEFPFSSLKKISDVVLEESSPLFPVPADELEFFWYPVLREKGKTTVSVIAFEKVKIEKWQRYGSSYKFRMDFYFEPFVLAGYVSRTTQQSNYICVFIDGNYVSRLVVKNNVVVESSSMYCEPERIENVFSEIVADNSEKLPVFCLGDTSVSGRTGNCRILPLQKGDFSSYFFSLYELFPALFSVVPFRLYSARRTEVSLNFAVISGFLLFFAISGVMMRPLFIARQAQTKLDSVNRQMEQTFKAAFPDAVKIVNPLVQARERLRNLGDVQQIVPRNSVISIMKTISEIVPENIMFKVSQMSLRGLDLFLTCSTDTLENVEVLTQTFKKAKNFQDVKVGGIMPESDRITFNLLIKLARNDKDQTQ